MEKLLECVIISLAVFATFTAIVNAIYWLFFV